MFNKILVTTDFTEPSRNIIKCLEELKSIGVKEATLIHILDIAIVEGAFNLLSKLLKPKIDEFENLLKELGFKTNSRIEVGNIGREINRVAKEGDYSFLVAGTHGESFLKQILLGSNIHKIVSYSEKPVLLIPLNVMAEKEEEKAKPICGEFFKNILYVTDFSEIALKSFDYLKEIAKLKKPKVTLFHVQDIKRIEPHLKDKIEEFNKIDEQRLEKLKEELKRLGITEIDLMIDIGNPSIKITELANSKKFTLLIIGTQGRGFMGDLFIGRVANYAIHHIDIPIFLVPPEICT